MEFIKEKKPCIDGIPLSYICHLQTTENPGLVYPAHYHDYIEILYGKENFFELYLGSSYHRFGPQDLVLVPAGEVHLIHSLSQNGGSYYVLRFLPELIYSKTSCSYLESQYLLPFLAQHSHQEQVISKEDTANSGIAFWIEEIFREDQEKKYGCELAIRNHIGSIFLWILRYWHEKGISLSSQSFVNEELARQLAPAFSYVREQFDTPVTASEAAKRCGMSYSYFSRSFNHVLHMNFREYVTHIRLTEAEKCLVSTSTPITDLAASCGFGSTSYFIKLFQQHKNMSPGQFRKSMQAANEKISSQAV